MLKRYETIERAYDMPEGAIISGNIGAADVFRLIPIGGEIQGFGAVVILNADLEDETSELHSQVEGIMKHDALSTAELAALAAIGEARGHIDIDMLDRPYRQTVAGLEGAAAWALGQADEVAAIMGRGDSVQ